MEILRKCILVYAIASCVACVIHMWRNRKKKEVVEVYAWTLVLELIFVLAYGGFLE